MYRSTCPFDDISIIEASCLLCWQLFVYNVSEFNVLIVNTHLQQDFVPVRKVMPEDLAQPDASRLVIVAPRATCRIYCHSQSHGRAKQTDLGEVSYRRMLVVEVDRQGLAAVHLDRHACEKAEVLDETKAHRRSDLKMCF